jgi:predicted MFS family arabinose efflux permease
MWFTFFLRVIGSTGWSAAMPFFGVYLSVSRGIPLGTVGVTYLLSGVLSFISQLIGGRLVDSFGCKRVMRIGYIAAAVTASITAYLVIINVNGLLLILLYPLFNFAGGISQPAISTMVANRSAADLRTGFSMQNIGGNLGFAIGPAMGGVLSEYVGYGEVFFVASFTYLVALASTVYWFRKGGHHDEDIINEKGQDTPKNVARYKLNWSTDSSLILLLASLFCVFLALGYEITPMSLFAANFLHIPNSLIGLLFATNGLLIVLAQMPMMRLYSRFSLVFPLVAASILIASSYFLVAVSSKFFELWIAMVIVTIGEVSLTVPAQLAITAFSESGNRGTFQGYYYAFSSGGRSIASFIGPFTFQILSSHVANAWYGIASFTLAIGAALAWISPRIERDYKKKFARDISSSDKPVGTS